MEKSELKITAFLDNKSFRVKTEFVTIVVLAFFEYLTGAKFSMYLFLLVPMFVAIWKGSFIESVIVFAVSISTWLVAAMYAGRGADGFLVFYLDAFVKFGFFIFFYMLLYRLKRLIQQEHYIAGRDFLTGLNNSRSFYSLMNVERERAERYDLNCMLAYIDLDNFKQINDAHGHLEGDRLLKVVSFAIQENIRKVDLAARLGGDEFAIFVPHMTKDESENIIEKLRLVLLSKMNENNWPVTFSIGSIYFKKIPGTVQEMIKSADDLMYVVKNSGKNAVYHLEYV